MRNTYDPKHVQSLCEPGDYGIFAPPMRAQVAVDELCRYFLGDDWYDCSGMTNTEQINTVIVAEIEQKYKGAKVKHKSKKKDKYEVKPITPEQVEEAKKRLEERMVQLKIDAVK